jgi:hypothetical protein
VEEDPMMRSRRLSSGCQLVLIMLVMGMIGPQSACEKRSPPAAEQPPREAETSPDGAPPSAEDAASSTDTGLEEPPMPVDIAIACRPWLEGGPAEGLEQAYAFLLAAKHPAAVAQYEATVRAARSADSADPASELTAQFMVLQASRGLWDESIANVLASLSSRGFDLYSPSILSAAEREAGLPEGSLAGALGVPEGFDPSEIRRGMLEFSARLVADNLLARGLPKDMVVALLRDSDEDVRSASQRLVASQLAADLTRRKLDVPAGFEEPAADPSELLSRLPEEARRLVAPDGLETSEAAHWWVIATMGFPAGDADAKDRKELASAIWDGRLFWAVYLRAIAGSLPLSPEDIDRLRSDDEWGDISRAQMHAAILAFVRTPGGVGAEWLAISDVESVTRLCQRPLWDEVVLQTAETAEPGTVVVKQLERSREVVGKDIETFHGPAGAAP